MDNLRLTLLIIGCFVVVGIYLWEIFYKANPKRKTDMLNAVDEVPDSPIPSLTTNETINDNYSPDGLADLGSLLAPSRNQDIPVDEKKDPFDLMEEDISESDEPLPLEMSVKDYEASMSENNDSDIFAAIEEDLSEEKELHEDEEKDSSAAIEDQTREEADIPESNKSSEDILVLYITSPSHISFNGLSISKAADEVGMIYGHMNIFHHFGPGKLHSGQPLFSLANMHEPGSFDLGKMAELKTKGLAVFMYSPASIDASVVFELFLNTTQRLAELLGGTVRTPGNEVLNKVAINTLREKAESLSAN